MLSRCAVFTITCLLLAPSLLFATETATPKIEKRKDSEEKQAISLFSVMCLQTGGDAEKIRQQLGKPSDRIEKQISTDDYIVGQTEDVWTVPSAVPSNPYVVSVTKGGTCYVAFNSTAPYKLHRDFKAFVTTQAANIKSKAQSVKPDVEVPDDLQVDFYDVKFPGTTHKIKFSLATPKDVATEHRSTMTVASE